MSRAENEGAESDTRSRILTATWRLMEQRRGHGVRVEDVAEAAGVSRQAVYLHFPSRTELMVATVRFADKSSGLEHRLGRVRGARSGTEALDAFVDFWGYYVAEIFGLARALMAARDTDPAAAAAWDDRMQAIRRGCRAVLEQLHTERRLNGAWPLAKAEDLMWSLISVSAWERLVIDCRWTADDYVTWVQKLLRDALVRPRPRRPSAGSRVLRPKHR